jgi:hypothetical protein
VLNKIRKEEDKMKCPNCNAENENNSKFCTSCGSPIPQPTAQGSSYEGAQYPPQAQNQYVPVGSSEAQGAPYQQQQPQYQPPQQAQQQQYQPTPVPAVQPYQVQPSTDTGNGNDGKPKKQKSKKGVKIAIGVIVAAIVIAVVVLLIVLFGGKKEETTKPMVYYTDSRLFVVQSLGSDEAKTFEVTNDYGGDYKLSEDSKYIVYTTDREEHTDEDNATSYTYNIYYKEIGNEKDEGTLVAKNVSTIEAVIGSIDKIIYAKDGNVCATDANGETEKLISDANVSSFSSDNSYFVATKCNQGEYDQEADEYGDPTYNVCTVDVSTGDKNKIVEGAQDYVFDIDSDTILYKKDDNLYSASAKDGSDKKIADKVESFASANGNIYYTVCDKKYTYYDLINDSMKDKDAKAKEPNWYDYEPNIEKYQKQETDDWGYSYTTTDYDAYQAAYDKAQEKYDKAYSDYQAALDRNNLREDLKADSNYKSYSLYNESGEKLASDLSYPSIMQINNLPNGTDSAGFTEYVNFSVYDTSIDSMKKVDITKISDSENISTKISEQITMHNVIYNGSKLISIEKEGYYCSTVNYDPDSSKFVVTFAKNYDSNSDDSSWDSVSIYSLPEEAESMSDAKTIAENIYVCLYANGEFMSIDGFSDNSNYKGTLHIKDKEIEDAAPFNIYYDPNEKDTYYYATDYSEKTGECNIYKYSNGNTEKVADDVINWSFGKYNGKFYAITDYDNDENYGDLICIDGDNNYTIDKKVKGVDNSELKSSTTLSAGDGE